MAGRLQDTGPALVCGTREQQAVRKHEMSETAVYAALKWLAKKQAKEAGMQACPCCGSMVPTERINRAVLKKTT
jgi:hypothetical protein